MVNFANNLTLHARSQPEKIALVEGDRTLTYAQLDSLTSRFANYLSRQSVATSDRVLIHSFNTLEFVIALFGAMKHGAVAVPVNKRLIGEDLERLVCHAKPRIVVTDIADRDLFTRTDAHVLDFGPGDRGAFWAEIRQESPKWREVGAQADQIANILYTSGTTGAPKAVIHTHGMRHAVAGAMTNRFELTRSDVGLAVSPFFHTGGLSVLCNCIHIGGTCVLMSKWEPRRMLEQVTKHGVTFAHFVSTLVVDITNLSPEALIDFTPRLRMTWSGGHSVDEWRLKEYERCMGGVLVQGYSRTEGGLTYNLPDLSLRSFAHNGLPCLDSNEIGIYAAASDSFCEPGTSGEIVVRGDGISPGYWTETEIRRPETVMGDWVRTGDSGFIDAAGALHFQGRIDHVIKSGGENVFPAEVEQAIIRSHDVETVVVLATPDLRFGEVVSALVVPRNPDLTADALRSFLRDKIAGYKIPRRIRFVDVLPVLGSGKVDLARSRGMLCAEPEEPS